ncbi:DUF5777 family beta-barrel protein [uncultured Polaribacter sp.]|uniref:DUF5777 family beta-barrel protein n=1 Tax=uncultured Polaribacter sp. TaxID=174711 RepID=UPI0026134761|nr:DUF5777 family beta-barrel protein [uncultured Polaribacter sp.]
MKNKKTHQLLIVLFLIVNCSINAQDLLEKLNQEFPDTPVYEIATFKTTRIGLGHSIETRKKGALQISLYNRYWNFPTPRSERFLADKVSSRYGLEYAFSDNFTAGLGYTNFDEISDGFLKYRLLKQQKNNKKRYVSITLVQGFSHRTNLANKDQFAFTSQALIARKINRDFSLQISPTFIHKQATLADIDPKSQFAIGFGGRHKIGGHTAIVSEYYYVANPLKSIDTYNAFMVGLNWEVGDLMVQLQVTNARNFAEDTFITQTAHNFNFKDPNLHFGFNVTFLLHTNKKK